MVEFVSGIFHDLSGRIQKMLTDLIMRQPTSQVPSPFFMKTLNLLHDVQRDVSLILSAPDLMFNEFAGNYLIKYNTLHERFLAIELYRYQAIVHYGNSENYFNALIAQIYTEVSCDQTTPLVACISNSDNYYWVYPAYDIIAVPFGEEKNLLNLPDIFHEIAHLLCGQYLRFFKGQGKIDRVIEIHFQSEIQNIEDENRDKAKIPELRKIFEYWKDSWVEEFICDLIATYLTGPAYAWTNLKISTLSSSDKGIYSFSAEHPSDDKRMYAVLVMLKRMGYNEEISLLNTSWENFLSICTNTRSALYNLYLPNHIIEHLSEIVFDACEKIGLNSCIQQGKEIESPLSQLLNQAWTENLLRPEGFSNWEHLQTELLQTKFLLK